MYTAWVDPASLALLTSSEASMPTVRTSFLESVAKERGIRYSVWSSVTSCRKFRATPFAGIEGKNT
jgi:hypothetical protein